MEEDQKWLVQSLNGDEQSFRKLVERYEHLVYTTVVGMLGEVPEAKDVTQEVFIRFYKSMHQFRGEASLGTYLSRIAINLSINEQKRRKRRRWLSISRFPALNSVVDNSSSPERTELKDTLRKAIQQLTPEFRAVVVLRLIDGYSVKEVAEILELPSGTIASRLSRAQEKLQKIIKQWQ
jgi:RNA polymerase sigma-70 factor (ECF subfamily)